MYHPRLKGNHYDMGKKTGSVFKANNVSFPVKLDAFQTQHGKASGALLQHHFPEAAQEIKGITDVLGTDNRLFTAWLMCMGCCLDIDDMQRCVEIRGCTAFSFTHNGRVCHGRNNDLPPFLKKVSKSIYYRPQNGNSFILNTSSFINGEEGINDRGLVAAMTFVVPKLEEVRPGLNSVFLVRYILEKCSTVREGIAALHNLPVASSCNIILTDRQGDMAVAECNPLKIHIRPPETGNNGEAFIVTVNHFTSETMRQHDAGNRDVFFSASRYETARNALMNMDDDNGPALARGILSGQNGFMCQYDKSLHFETIWSSVFDLTAKKVYRAEGSPDKVQYKEDTRLNSKPAAPVNGP